MSATAKWIFLCSLLLIVPQILDGLRVTSTPMAAGCGKIAIPFGIGLLLTGLASMQRARLLRLGGIAFAGILSIGLTAIYSWWAAGAWRGVHGFSLNAALLSFTALSSVATFWSIIRLRPREGIETRGYAVTFSPLRRPSKGPFMSPPDAR